MKRFLIVTLLTVFLLATFSGISNSERKFSFSRDSKVAPQGISIVLYRVEKSDDINKINNLEAKMVKSKSINLYKIAQDLSIIFMNTSKPYNDTSALPYRMLFGRYVNKQAGEKIINGFVSTKQVAEICGWIRKNKINTYSGFSKMYDALNYAPKKELDNIGAEGKKELFDGYVKALTEFYFIALKEKNSIVICGE